jgi:opacity protein-like surface antigen
MRNDYSGFQGGADIGSLDFGATGWNAHIGVTGGQYESSATSQQGSGLVQSTVPFVGMYAALFGPTGFFVDGQVVGQFYSLNVSEPSIAAAGSIKGTGIGITSSAGYHWDIGNGWFIEPSVGVVYSRVRLDPLNVAPTVDGTPLGLRTVTIPTVLNLGDIVTLPARIGGRVGTSFTSGGVTLQPFVAASVWHEFAGDTTMSATFSPPTAPSGTAPSLNLNSNRIGTFGQYSLGFAANVLNTGWAGYARVDYRSGENIQALNVNGGIRYQLEPPPASSSAPAPTAPLVTKAPRMLTKAPVAAPAAEPWAGFYVGGFAGGAWSGGSVAATELAPGAGGRPFFNGIGTQTSYDLDSNGIVGLTLGYNYQMGTFLAGWEAEGAYLRLTGSAPFSVNPETISSTKIGNWYSVLAGRLGVVVGPALIYAKGGAAFVSITDSVIDSCLMAPPCATPSRTVAAAGANSIGATWAAGGGLEFAVSNTWSVKGEYLALGTNNSITASGPGLVARNDPQIFNWQHNIPIVQTAKIGVNYKFVGPGG